MKTPYDAALRAIRRQVDDLRAALVAVADQLQDIEIARRDLSEAIARESALAAAHWALPARAYLARLREQQDRLAADRYRTEARLVALRGEAAEAFGALRAVEGAADAFLAHAARTADSAEQREFDDFAAARLVRARRRAADATTGYGR